MIANHYAKRYAPTWRFDPKSKLKERLTSQYSISYVWINQSEMSIEKSNKLLDDGKGSCRQYIDTNSPCGCRRHHHRSSLSVFSACVFFVFSVCVCVVPCAMPVCCVRLCWWRALPRVSSLFLCLVFVCAHEVRRPVKASYFQSAVPSGKYLPPFSLSLTIRLIKNASFFYLIFFGGMIRLSSK